MQEWSRADLFLACRDIVQDVLKVVPHPVVVCLCRSRCVLHVTYEPCHVLADLNFLHDAAPRVEERLKTSTPGNAVRPKAAWGMFTIRQSHVTDALCV